MDSTSVAERVAGLRTARGWSRARFAEMVEMEPSAYRSIETGRVRVTVEALITFAGALGVTVMDLLTEPGADAPEVVVTVTRHYCERCLGKVGEVEGLVRADINALEGVIGLNRGLAAQAIVLAAAMDECPDPPKLAVLSRELRMVIDTLTERVTPRGSSDSGKKNNTGGGGADFANLGVPVISA